MIAPAFWFLVLGLPGLFAYRAINTADSTIGHLTPRHEHFGWAAARLDDLVNLPASRLAGALVALAAPAAGGSIGRTFRIMVAEATHHRSPNAGWPVGGDGRGARPRARRSPPLCRHHRQRSVHQRQRAGATPDPADIRRALSVYLIANAIFFVLVVAAAAAVVLVWS